MKLLAILGLGTVLVGVGVRSADACSPPPCWPGAFVPGDRAHVPANLPGIVWRPMRDYSTQVPPDPAMVSLVATDDPTTPIALVAHLESDGTYTLAPTGLAPGKQYRLVDATRCAQGAAFETPSATFTTTAIAPLPTTLGATTATSAETIDVQLATAVGSCSVAATISSVDVALDYASDAGPWNEVLLFSTTVDDAPWGAASAINAIGAPGTSWTGRGKDRVFELCSGGDDTSPRGVSAGLHDVTLHATLANTTIALAASPTTIGLTCGGGPICDDTVPTTRAEPTGCMSASRATPGALAIALLVVLRRRAKKVAS